MADRITWPNGLGGTSTLDTANIISCEYTEQVNNATDVRFGCAIASCITVRARGTTWNGPSSGDKVAYYHDATGSGTFSLVGYFYVDKVKMVSDTTYTFDAYDSISKLDKDLTVWLDQLNRGQLSVYWPITLVMFAGMVCDACGLTLANSSFTNSNFYVHEFHATGITGRTLLSKAAELAGCYIKVDAFDRIELAGYTANGTVKIAPTGTAPQGDTATYLPYYAGSLHRSHVSTVLPDLVRIRRPGDDVGVAYPVLTGSEYLVDDNILTTGASDSEISQAAQNLYYVRISSTYQYFPASFRVIPTNLLHAGQVVGIYDASGNYICNTLIMKCTWKDDGVTCESTGNESLGSPGAIAGSNYANPSQSQQAPDLTGYVTTSSLSTSGGVTVNAGNITTGTMDSARISFASPLTISQINGLNSLAFGEYASITKRTLDNWSPLEIYGQSSVVFTGSRPVVRINGIDYMILTTYDLN